MKIRKAKKAIEKFFGFKVISKDGEMRLKSQFQTGTFQITAKTVIYKERVDHVYVVKKGCLSYVHE